ncbi:hypothetical protein DIS24_g5619 [Lasiodiplodia hormozganensis]|uniref:Afadin and alpha-actinin-binding-domain-containing protein n=1 Tax=Lasiodiplodia hormozganensis TaxID=869390 RepID=A0AA39YLW0_9PEZI|nr:hypothetical protein DIS24_g5619 [Lasiodiplodia hormozganensis]
MDPQSLKSASSYLNNLLLARGLLRNGKPIEFAHPSKGEGGKQETMAQIINLVHDLILRRDREQEQRDSLSQTLRAVRAENQQAASTLDRLTQRSEDLQRQLSLAQSSERSAKTALRSAESSARSLREEMVRLKATVQQVRTACANDVRKRDVQIQRLKSHLTAQQRGNKTGLVGASITITPGSMSTVPASMGRDDDMPSLEDAEYSLRQETTEFLTQLSQSLSDENDNLIGLVRSTLATLRELQGMPELGHNEESAHVDGDYPDTTMAHALPTSYEALATDMDHVLEHLRSLLTNPNFVPISEVESREDEIMKLRDGWEKMESRWRDVVTMMQGWRQRMMDGGDTITLDELRMGLCPGGMLAPVEEEDEEEDEGEMESEVDTEDEEEYDIDEEPALPSPEKPVPESRKTDLFDIKLDPTPHNALRESDGNMRSPRKVIFAPSNNNTPNHAFTDENASEVDLVKSGSRASSKSNSRSGSKPSSTSNPLSAPRQLPQPPVSEVRGRPTPRPSGIPRSTRKRRSSPLPHEDEPSPKLTVQEKLSIAAQEAEEAAALAARTAAAEKEEAADNRKVTAAAAITTIENDPIVEENENVNTRPRRTPRRGNVKGRAKRRKSTLSPEELEALMGLAD